MIAAGWDSWNPQAMNDTHKIYELYGDRLLIAVIPEPFDPEKTTEEEQREAARKLADQFCTPGKPSAFNINGVPYLTPAFSEELYRQSRINYASKRCLLNHLLRVNLPNYSFPYTERCGFSPRRSVLYFVRPARAQSNG